MCHRRAFTFTDMLAAMSLLAIILIHSLVGCGEERRRGPSGSTTGSFHVRYIHTCMVLYAQGNKDYFPGLTADGKKATESVAADPAQKTFGFATPDGTLTAYRFAVLLRGSYFSPEIMKSSAETNEKITPPVPGQNFADGSAYSFTMLNISDVKQPRVREWRATNNSKGVVVSDRNVSSVATGTDAESIHTIKGEGWRGWVGYNDNHVIFEVTDVVKTEYDRRGMVNADLLFSDKELAGGKVPGADAAMVFKAGDSYVNQQP